MTAGRRNRLLNDDFLATLSMLDLCARMPVNNRFAGSHRSKAYGGVSEFGDYREYQPGDDLRRIDWNLAGRTGQYYVKQFLDEKKQTVSVCFDTSLSMRGEADSDKAMTALRVGAAVAYLAVQAMDSVALYAMNGTDCVPLAPVINCRSELIPVLDRLGETAFSGTCDIGAAIAGLSRFAGAGTGLTVLVSDLMTDSDWKGAIRALKARRQDVFLICVLSEGEEDPAYRGSQSLADVENTAADPFHAEVDRDMLHAYQDAFRWFRHDVETFCSAEHVALAFITGHEKPEEVLIRQGFASELMK